MTDTRPPTTRGSVAAYDGVVGASGRSPRAALDCAVTKVIQLTMVDDVISTYRRLDGEDHLATDETL